MPAPGQSTFDGNPNLQTPTTQGYRPGVDDFNGAAMTDLGGPYVPNPATMPTAALYNTYGKLLVSACRMMPWGAISIVAGGVPTVAYWKVAANNVQVNPFTVTRNGVGDYSLTYNTGIFPAPNLQAEANLNAQLGAHNYSIGVVNITNGIRVTTTQDGVLTDLPFTAKFH